MSLEADAEQGVTEVETAPEPETVAEEGAAAEAAETAETKDEAPAETEEGAKSKEVPPWAEKRFGELTKQKHDAIKRAEEAEARAKALQALVDAGVGKTEEDEPQGREAPNGKTFLTDDELEARAAQIAETRAKAKAFNDRCNSAYEAGEKAFGDKWDGAIKNLRLAGLINEGDLSFLEAALETEAPERVLHALGTDPDEALRIANLSPMKRAIEMDRLATKLGKPVAPPERRAPPPVETVEGAGSPGFDPENCSMEEFEKWRAAQEAKRRA